MRKRSESIVKELRKKGISVRRMGWIFLVCLTALVMLSPCARAFAVCASAENVEEEIEDTVETAAAAEIDYAPAELEGVFDDPLTEKLVVFLCYLINDIVLFDLNNTDPARVAAAYYFAGYKGQVLFFGDWSNGRSGSFGRLLGLHISDKNVKNLFRLEELLKHENGHYEQYKLIGFAKYVLAIAIPSFMNDPVDYYSQPWEVTADLLGGVTSHRHTQGSEEAGWRYLNAVRDSGVLEILFDLIKG